MEKIEYCKELSRLIKHAHSMFTVKTSDSSTPRSAKSSSKYLFSVLYLDKTEQDNICGLYFLLRKHPELSDLQIKQLINQNKETFPALQFLLHEHKDLITSLQTIGFNKTCSNIVKDRMLAQDVKNLY